MNEPTREAVEKAVNRLRSDIAQSGVNLDADIVKDIETVCDYIEELRDELGEPRHIQSDVRYYLDWGGSNRIDLTGKELTEKVARLYKVEKENAELRRFAATQAKIIKSAAALRTSQKAPNEDELRDHQAEAWIEVATECVMLGCDHTEPGKVACEQVINWIKRKAEALEKLQGDFNEARDIAETTTASNCRTIARLEKENAELIEDLNTLQKVYDNQMKRNEEASRLIDVASHEQRLEIERLEKEIWMRDTAQEYFIATPSSPAETKEKE